MRIILVSAPFGPLRTPSLGLSTLKALAAAEGYEVRIWYSMLNFAAQIGKDMYELLAEGAPSTTDLTGEWLFSPSRGSAWDEQYLTTIILSRSTVRRRQQKKEDEKLRELVTRLQQLRMDVPRFVDNEADQIVSLQPTLVGFTTVFQQTMASTAIAQALKDRNPNIQVAFGGANCESPMGLELLRHHSCIDAVASGEGENDFIELLAGPIPTSHDGRGASVSGLIRPDVSETTRFVPLERLPVPDFSDYFEQLARLTDVLKFQPRLPYEASRGCWWAAKVHCTFCGLNGGAMAYRSKSAGKVFDDLQMLLDRYGRLPIDFVDNILGLDYLKTLIPRLANEALQVPLFFETKANLKRAQVELLKRAGVIKIQPGIESLSDSVLQIMGKGVRAIHNIQLLKWCSEFGIEASWNWLWGFPSEAADEYDVLAKLVPLIEHLQPPTVASTIRLDRFSPLFERSAEMKLTNVQPYPSYQFVFGDYDREALARVAYYFTFDYVPQRDVTVYTSKLADAIEKWQQNFSSSELVSLMLGDYLWVWDTRSSAKQKAIVLRGLDCDVLQGCNSTASIEELVSECFPATASEIEESLDRLQRSGLIVRLGNAFLSLALQLETYEPQGQKLAMLARVIQDSADVIEDGKLILFPSTHCLNVQTAEQ